MHDVAFRSIEEFVATEVGATPLAAQIDAGSYDRLLADARQALAGYVAADGSSRVPIESHVVRAVPRPTSEQ